MKLQNSIGKYGSRFTKSTKAQVVALLLAFVLASTLISQSAIYTGGWEVTTSLDKVKVNGQWYSSSRKPKEILEGEWGGGQVYFDIDDPNKGVPNIKVHVGNPAQYVIDRRTGEWVRTTSGEPFDKLQKNVGDNVFFFNHFVYRFHTQIVADPDYETIWGTTYGEAQGLQDAKEARVTVRAKVTTDPWADYLVPDFEGEAGSYLFDNGWSAVMSSRVVEGESGFVGYTDGNEPQGTGGKVIKRLTTGQLNMWVQGLGEAPTSRGRMPSEVSLDVSCTLLPAYRYDAGLFGVGSKMTTYAVYCKYLIEVHLMTVGSYKLEAGKMDEDLADIDYDEDASAGLSIPEMVGEFLAPITDFLSGLMPGLAFGGIIALVILSIVAVIGVKVLQKIYGRN